MSTATHETKHNSKHGSEAKLATNHKAAPHKTHSKTEDVQFGSLPVDSMFIRNGDTFRKFNDTEAEVVNLADSSKLSGLLGVGDCVALDATEMVTPVLN